MRERMTGVQEEQRRLDNQKELHKKFLKLFSDEEDAIKKGKFVDQIPIRGEGSPAVGDVLICMSNFKNDPHFDFWNSEKFVVTGKENDDLQIHTTLFSNNSFIKEYQFILGENLAVNSGFKKYFDNKLSNYSFSYVKELFLYPSNTEKKQTA